MSIKKNLGSISLTTHIGFDVVAIGLLLWLGSRQCISAALLLSCIYIAPLWYIAGGVRQLLAHPNFPNRMRDSDLKEISDEAPWPIPERVWLVGAYAVSAAVSLFLIMFTPLFWFGCAFAAFQTLSLICDILAREKD